MGESNRSERLVIAEIIGTERRTCGECREFMESTFCSYLCELYVCGSCLLDHYSMHQLAGDRIELDNMHGRDLRWAELVKACANEHGAYVLPAQEENKHEPKPSKAKAPTHSGRRPNVEKAKANAPKLRRSHAGN